MVPKQRACQIAFRSCRWSNQMWPSWSVQQPTCPVCELRLYWAQRQATDLAAAREAYDAAARAAQLEVQKTRQSSSKSETEHVSALSPDQLEQLFVSLAEAATTGRTKTHLHSDGSKSGDGGTTTPPNEHPWRWMLFNASRIKRRGIREAPSAIVTHRLISSHHRYASAGRQPSLRISCPAATIVTRNKHKSPE